MDIAAHRGILSGTAWAMQLLEPLSVAPRPTCPYPFWRPIRRLAWRIGFSWGVYSVLHGRR